MIDERLVAQSADPKAAFRYVCSPELAALLEAAGASLLVTTYQAGKLIVIRSCGGRISTLLRTFDQAMGLAWIRGGWP